MDQQYLMQIAMLLDSLPVRVWGKKYTGKLEDRKLVFRSGEVEAEDPETLEERKRQWSQMYLAKLEAMARSGSKRRRHRTDGRQISR
ncbi:MAG TPA: hypothetical protein VD932_02645 [Aquabacterium sp.]|nr:hypothetical protein [Aquabacterium sp.]